MRVVYNSAQNCLHERYSCLCVFHSVGRSGRHTNDESFCIFVCINVYMGHLRLGVLCLMSIHGKLCGGFLGQYSCLSVTP